jgi:protease I
MRHLLFLLPVRDFKDVDFTEPRAVLEQEGYTVRVAATEWTCRGSLGTTVQPHLLVRNVDPHEFDALVIVGGVGARDYAVDNTVIELVQEFARLGKPIAAIGNGVVVLAAADLLKDRWVSAAAVDQAYVAGKGAKLSNKEITVDGRFLTAVGSQVAHTISILLANLLRHP